MNLEALHYQFSGNIKSKTGKAAKNSRAVTTAAVVDYPTLWLPLLLSQLQTNHGYHCLK